MKRVWALLIDEMIVFLVMSIIGVIILLSNLGLDPPVYQYISTLMVFIYMFSCDYFFKGVTIGKKCLGIKTYYEDEKPNYLLIALVHSFFRFIFGFAVIVGAFFYIAGNGKMFYEKWLHISIRPCDEKDKDES